MKVKELAKDISNSSKFPGTTAVAIFFVNGRCFIGNVGDSRCYIYRGGVLKQLTEDHCIPYARHVLTNVMGQEELPCTVDVFDTVPKKGDCSLLCSDGLVDEVDDERIEEIMNEFSNLKDRAEALINAANDLGGRDNITVALMEVTSL